MTTKKQDNRAYCNLLHDITKAEQRLVGKPCRENFGEGEVRKLKDKYSDYMSGNWSVCGRFVEAVKRFDDWCANYTGGC